MLEELVKLDQNLFEALNSIGIETLDPVMLLLSATWIWFPLCAIITFLFFKQDPKKAAITLLFLLITVGLTDLISVQVFKESIQRLRPCYEPEISERIRLVAANCGGQYGFISTHASNAFGLAAFSILVIKNKWFSIAILTWAILVSYSRIYLGVHYPGDVLGGIIFGLLTGFLTFKLLSRILQSRLFYGKEN